MSASWFFWNDCLFASLAVFLGLRDSDVVRNNLYLIEYLVEYIMYDGLEDIEDLEALGLFFISFFR